MMSDTAEKLFERLRAKYKNYTKSKYVALEEEIRAEWLEEAEPHNPPNWSYLADATCERVHESFIKDINEEFNSLSPEERMALFGELLQEAKEELDSGYGSKYFRGTYHG